MHILRQWKCFFCMHVMSCFFVLHACQPIVGQSRNQNMNQGSSRIQGCMEEHLCVKRQLFFSASPNIPALQNQTHADQQCRLTSVERRRRLTRGLCLDCCQDGHVIRTCPTHPPRPVVSVVSTSSVNIKPPTTTVQITTPHHCVSVYALLYSG